LSSIRWGTTAAISSTLAPNPVRTTRRTAASHLRPGSISSLPSGRRRSNPLAHRDDLTRHRKERPVADQPFPLLADHAGPLDGRLDARPRGLQPPGHPQAHHYLVDVDRALYGHYLLDQLRHSAARHLVHLRTERDLRRLIAVCVGPRPSAVEVLQADLRHVHPLILDDPGIASRILQRRFGRASVAAAMTYRETTQSGCSG